MDKIITSYDNLSLSEGKKVGLGLMNNLTAILAQNLKQRVSLNELDNNIYFDNKPIELKRLAIKLEDELAETLKTNFPHHKIADRLVALAQDNPFHPIKKYLENLTPDGTDYIDRLIDAAKIDVRGDRAFVRRMLICFFVGSIKRIYEPGCAFHTVLALVGASGGGKSGLFNELGLTKYFTAAPIGTMNHQVASMIMNKSWIIEFQEGIGMMNTSDHEKVKAFITQAVETYKRPYDSQIVDEPRRCVFVMSANSYDWLADDTWRRYFVLTTTSSQKHQMDWNWIDNPKNIEGIYAQAFQEYKKGTSEKLIGNDILVWHKWSEAHMTINRTEEKIFDYLDIIESGELSRKRVLSNSDIEKVFGDNPPKNLSKTLTNIMRKRGYIYKPSVRDENGDVKRGWTKDK